MKSSLKCSPSSSLSGSLSGCFTSRSRSRSRHHLVVVVDHGFPSSFSCHRNRRRGVGSSQSANGSFSDNVNSSGISDNCGEGGGVEGCDENQSLGVMETTCLWRREFLGLAGSFVAASSGIYAQPRGARAADVGDDDDEDEAAAVDRMNDILAKNYNAEEGFTSVDFQANASAPRVAFDVPKRWKPVGPAKVEETRVTYPGWSDPVTGVSADGAQVAVRRVDASVANIENLGQVDRVNLSRDLGLDSALLRRGDVYASRSRKADDGTVWYEWDVAVAPDVSGVRADVTALMEQGDVVLVSASVDASTNHMVSMLVRANRSEWSVAESALRAMRKSFGAREVATPETETV
uniref:PsbP C-terminal domain-containing protein n=1 Tax=Pycnococcus provasolii TaxID=41880 RepID=A0A7S2B7V0_9CHLO|mmetsp:Transcript_6709/g.15246  ORF Transcript_6709/g.15246 Transcript_6709/m.15246 type:complete len:349 (+) Transcript_6709:137-1183(+)